MSTNIAPIVDIYLFVYQLIIVNFTLAIAEERSDETNVSTKKINLND
jgi:hypothetical protein